MRTPHSRALCIFMFCLEKETISNHAYVLLKITKDPQILCNQNGKYSHKRKNNFRGKNQNSFKQTTIL